ncbi:MAG: histidine kinase [Archangium sp.]|nr:histidine kinase [Archangium sp.]MDP3569335.1 histidine kinase [Archangium sp.]
MTAHPSGVIAPDELAEELRRALAESSARAEARGRSTPTAGRALVAALALAGGRWWVGAAWPQLFGELSLLRTSLLLVVVSSAFFLATLAYHALGAEHRLYRVTAAVDRLCRTSALMTSLVLSGEAALFFLLVCLPRGFAWRAESAHERRRTIAVELLGYSLVAGACAGLGRPASAAVVLLSLGAFGVAYGMTARSTSRSMRARVERDLLDRTSLGLEVTNLRGRAARELHDGVGADVMALVLQLRDASARDPKAAGLAQRAEQVLAGLRSVVWWLRKEEGTVGELAKLVDATCSKRCAGLTYLRRPLAGDATLRLGSAVALGLLRAAQELVRLGGQRTNATQVTLSLDAGATLELNVEADGLEPADGVSDAFEVVREQIEALDGSLEVRGPGLRARVVVPRRFS